MSGRPRKAKPPRMFEMPIIENASVPRNEIEFRLNGKVVGRIVRVLVTEE
jgi:hypothetical protein